MNKDDVLRIAISMKLRRMNWSKAEIEEAAGDLAGQRLGELNHSELFRFWKNVCELEKFTQWRTVEMKRRATL